MATTHVSRPGETRAATRSPVADPIYQGFTLLRVGFTVAPILFGLDKFLNWLTMSKLDIEKKILTGGKYDNPVTAWFTIPYNPPGLVAETRGCSGRKFIKTVPGIPDLTFAVRGGTTSGIDKVTSQATEYGQT